jgi:hypothetical protein
MALTHYNATTATWRHMISLCWSITEEAALADLEWNLPGIEPALQGGQLVLGPFFIIAIILLGTAREGGVLAVADPEKAICWGGGREPAPRKGNPRWGGGDPCFGSVFIRFSTIFNNLCRYYQELMHPLSTHPLELPLPYSPTPWHHLLAPPLTVVDLWPVWVG